MAGEREITIRIVGDASKAQQTFKDVGSAAGTFEGKIDGANSKWSTFAGTMGGVLASGAIQQVAGFLKDGATGAAEDAAAMDRLKTAVENTGVSFDSHNDAIQDAITKGQELAFSDGDIMSALTNLTNATGDSDEALRRLTLAQDLARGTGMSLEQASKLLGKTSDENTATLSRYGIQLDKNATAQDVLNEVDKRFGGQAAAFAESDAGKWAAVQLQMTELQETIGGMLIPVFTLLATTLSLVFTALQPLTTLIGNNLTPVLLALTPVLIAVAAAWMASVVPAIYASVVAFVTLNAAVLPWIALAAAIGVAIAALYLAWSTNFLGIQDITQSVIDFVTPYITSALATIQSVFDTVWPYIQTLTDLVFQAISLYVTTYIAVVQTIIETVLPIIQAIFETVWPIIQTLTEVAFSAIAAYVTTYIAIVQTVVETALAAVQLVFNTVWPAAQVAVETAMTGISTAVDKIHDAYNTIATVLASIQTAFTTVWNAIVSLVGEKVQAIVSTVTGFASALYDAGASLIQNLIDGISDKLDALKDKVGSIGGIIGDIDVPGFSPIDEAGYHMGRLFTEEFARGLGDGTQFSVQPATANVGHSLSGGGPANHAGGAVRHIGSPRGGSGLEDRIERAIERGIRRALSGAT